MSNPNAGIDEWTRAVNALTSIATDDAIEEMCRVYFRRKISSNPNGVYMDRYHDELCDLVTKCIFQIGNQRVFATFLQFLDRSLKGEKWFNDWHNEETNWMYYNLRNSLNKASQTDTFRTFISAWLQVAITQELTVFLVNSIHWTHGSCKRKGGLGKGF